MNKISNKLFEDISPVLFIGALLISSFIFAQDNDEELTVDSVTIIGTKDDVKDVAGSGAVISNEDLEKAMDTDIQKILTAVPGVYMLSLIHI